MLRITIELHSAITGGKKVLGVMDIFNKGVSSDPKRGDYGVRVYRKGSTKDVLRSGEVKNYPRLSYNVWRLVLRALKSAFPEESLSSNQFMDDLKCDPDSILDEEKQG